MKWFIEHVDLVIVIATSFVSAIGAIGGVWSLRQTRLKYYNEFRKRRRDD